MNKNGLEKLRLKKEELKRANSFKTTEPDRYARIKQEHDELRETFRKTLTPEQLEESDRVSNLLKKGGNYGERRVSPSFALTPEEIEQLYSVFSSTKIAHIKAASMVSLSISCALRASELLNLETRDLVWNKNRVEAIRIFKTKNKKDYVLPVNNTAWLYLEKYLATREATLKKYNATAERLYCVLMPERSDRFFVTGQPVTISTWANMLKKYGKKAGIQKHLRTHVLRHTGITLFNNICRDPFKTRIFAHHDRIDSTMAYIHKDPASIVEVINQFDGPSPEELKKQEAKEKLEKLEQMMMELRKELEA